MSIYTRHISGTLVFRSAINTDIPAITAILKMAVEQMLADGKCQWNENYPNDVHVRSDIDRSIGYVLVQDGTVIGYVAVVFTGEPAYDLIDGKWLSEGKYVVAHRMAINQTEKGKGMGVVLMNAVEEYARSLGIKSFKIDTNYDNPVMLGLLDKLGFTYCGEIEYESGTRKAFEKQI